MYQTRSPIFEHKLKNDAARARRRPASKRPAKPSNAKRFTQTTLPPPGKNSEALWGIFLQKRFYGHASLIHSHYSI